MKQKTKTRLASLGLVATSAIGLGCVGFGIYAITQMRRPYLNQWVDFQENKEYKPIVNPIRKEEVAKILHQDVEDLTDDDIFGYYLQKIQVTPEIFVEDFIHDYHEEFKEKDQDPDFIWSRYIIRLSDVSIRKDSEDNTYKINFRWDQDIHGESKVGNPTTYGVDWYMVIRDLPLLLTKKNDNWNINFDWANTNWTGLIKISETHGSFEEQPLKPETPINSGNISSELVLNYFWRELQFDSQYLSWIKIEN